MPELSAILDSDLLAIDGSNKLIAKGLRETAGPADLTVGAVADGSFLRRSGTGLVGVTPIQLWMPDARPTSPHASDNEFDSSIADFTTWDPGALMSSPAPAIDATRSMLKLEVPYNGSGSAWAGVYKAVPASEFAMYVKMHALSMYGSTGARVAAFVAGDLAGAPSTADFRGVEITSGALGAGTMNISCRLWTAYNAAPGAGAPSVASSSAGGWARIRCNGTTAYFDWSDDGVGWVHLNEVTLGFTPAYIALAASTHGATNTKAIGLFDYVRFFSGAGTSGQNATKIGRLVQVGAY